jgi:LacI family transcriptional regulator
MKDKRVTIYDLANELGISASYVSRALNNHPSISEKIKKLVKGKADELNYKHNSQAANLRRGSSKTIGVIVPKINESFFSQAIAGIEEDCFANHHSLIICQSGESLTKEKIAVDTLISNNVDCILISISMETKTSSHLKEIIDHNIHLIQFDRYLSGLESYKILNDNKDVSYQATKHLINEGYRRIAYIGGPGHIAIFKDRKEGFLKAIKEHELNIPYNFIVEDGLSREMGAAIANELLSLKEAPDAFLTASDYASLGVLNVARSLGINVPEQLGIIGFANEEFTELVQPALSSIDQKSKELGRFAVDLYFKDLIGKNEIPSDEMKIIKSEIIIRQSSSRNAINKV